MWLKATSSRWLAPFADLCGLSCRASSCAETFATELWTTTLFMGIRKKTVYAYDPLPFFRTMCCSPTSLHVAEKVALFFSVFQWSQVWLHSPASPSPSLGWLTGWIGFRCAQHCTSVCSHMHKHTHTTHHVPCESTTNANLVYTTRSTHQGRSRRSGRSGSCRTNVRQKKKKKRELTHIIMCAAQDVHPWWCVQ